MRGNFGCPQAIAVVRGGAEAPELMGKVAFYRDRGGVIIVAEISGLPENDSGFYGFHIHSGSSCGGTNFSETGSHYDLDMSLHPRHAGDLPPLLRSGNGAFLAVRTDRFNISEIVGRTVVIHSEADDFHTQPAGNSGDKIACGIIRRV